MEIEALIKMEIENFISKMKDIYSALIIFIDTNDDTEDEFKKLINTFEKHKIFENKGEVKLIFQLISKIFDNYHRTSEFLDKLEKIIQYLINDFSSSIPNFILDYTKYNKKLLFLILEKMIIKPDDAFLKKYLQSKSDEEFQLFYYLYPKIKEFLEEKTQNQIEKEILEKFDEDISSFEKKCQIGENDSYICSLIRSDSVEDFVSYVNRTNFRLSSKIKPSFFETNSFLIDKEPTLIEYAIFFGSIQIIQYLKYNNVPLSFSLWIYAIHSNNAEIIHFLEENEIKPDNKSYDEVFLESIKCHHNDISNYIKDNFYDQIQTDDLFLDNFSDTIINSLNFFFFPNQIDSKNNKGFKLSKLHFLLKQITIPSSVTLIENDTFYKCTLLTQISIPSSVTSIGNDAFYGCSSLSKVSFENNSVTKIGNDVFYGCESLTQIEIPQSVTLIGNGAFYGCSSLTQIIIPQSVTSIGNDVFYGCSSLTQIAIPSSVTSIGNNAFYKCSLLAQVSFEIPSLITYIGNGVFYECTSLKQITIPSSVTTIGNGAFYGCLSLTQITIPSSVTSIGYYALYGCTSLMQVSFEIPSSLTVIGNASFFGCASLKQITIPSSVTSIGVFSFTGCSSLEQISIPSSVTSIKNSVNESSSSLTQIIRLVDIIKELSILVETKENYPKLYTLPTIITKTNHSKRIRKITVGPQVSSSKDQIKILIVGETGSGKTAFINCIANYLYGVKRGDDCRFIVAPNGYEYEKNVYIHNSANNYIIEYTFYWQPGFTVPYTVTLIDTPGFHSIDISNQYESLLKNVNDFGIEYLNAVAITIQSSIPRLNSFHISILSSIMKFFGNDTTNNFIIIATFADIGEPQVLHALRDNHIPTDFFVKCNNSTYSEFKGEHALINNFFWNIGQESIKNVFKYIKKMEPKSLNHFSDKI